MRPLLIAESANPTFVSVPLIGWSLCTTLQQMTGAHIVTQVRNREAFLDHGMREGTDFTAIDSEKLAAPLYRLNRKLRAVGLGWTVTTALAAIGYSYFEKLVAEQFSERIESGEFDIVHRVTPVSPAVSSHVLGKLCRQLQVPFILGPINGGVPWPKGYRRMQLAEGELLSSIRPFLLKNPRRNQTLAGVSAILTGSGYAAKEIPSRYHDKSLYISENAVHSVNENTPENIPGKLRVVFIGRLVKLKMVDALIRASEPFLRSNSLTLDIIGDGPEMDRLTRLAAFQGVSDKVVFHGWKSHDEVMSMLPDYDALGFPSIREFGGGVVLEAMANGLVPIVINYAGPGELVDDKSGFRIPLGPPDQIVDAYQRIFQKMIDDPSILPPMQAACIERIRDHFSWDAKAKKILEVYRWAMGERHTNPASEPGFLSYNPAEA